MLVESDSDSVVLVAEEDRDFLLVCRDSSSESELTRGRSRRFGQSSSKSEWIGGLSSNEGRDSDSIVVVGRES